MQQQQQQGQGPQQSAGPGVLIQAKVLLGAQGFVELSMPYHFALPPILRRSDPPPPPFPFSKQTKPLLVPRSLECHQTFILGEGRHPEHEPDRSLGLVNSFLDKGASDAGLGSVPVDTVSLLLMKVHLLVLQLVSLRPLVLKLRRHC